MESDGKDIALSLRLAALSLSVASRASRVSIHPRSI